jgi:hypothetical protein
MTTTTLNNVSLPINNVQQQIYLVPTGVTASIVLNVAICSVVPAAVIQIFLFKQKIDNTFITLIPGRQIAANDKNVYSPDLNKLILLAGEKIFAQALTTKIVRSSGNLFGIPCYFDPLQPTPPSQVAYISLSVAERTN